MVKDDFENIVSKDNIIQKILYSLYEFDFVINVREFLMQMDILYRNSFFGDRYNSIYVIGIQ